jgi:hypothetical protein
VHPSESSVNQSDFLCEEYKTLRAEVIVRLKDYEALERHTVVACAAIVAWIAKGENNAMKWVWLVPVLVSSLAGLRAFGMYKRLQGLGIYLKKIEDHFRLPEDAPGWEHFRARENTLQENMISASAWALWIILNVATWTVAVVAIAQ